MDIRTHIICFRSSNKSLSEKYGHLQLLRQHKNDRFEDSNIRGPYHPPNGLHKEQEDVES